MKKIHIALFASGSGTNAENIMQQFKDNAQVEVVLLLASKEGIGAIERANKFNVPTVVYKRADFDAQTAVENTLKEYAVDYIVLAGFLLKVPDWLINMYPQKICNIHPSLLPKHGGKGMFGEHVHQDVLDCKETESGITIHKVNNIYDSGEILFQAKCPVLPSDDAHTLAARVHELEYQHFPQVILKWILE